MPSKHGPKVEKFYGSTEWKKVRAIKLRQSHYVCERCGKPYGMVHHKIHLTESNVDDPDISINLDNLIVLCEDCHNKEHFSKHKERKMSFDSNGDIVWIEDDF